MPEPYSPEVQSASVNVPANLILSRRGARLTQDELAKLLGIAPRLIRYYESGERAIKDDLLVEWARKTGYPLGWFFQNPVAA